MIFSCPQDFFNLVGGNKTQNQEKWNFKNLGMKILALKRSNTHMFTYEVWTLVSSGMCFLTIAFTQQFFCQWGNLSEKVLIDESPSEIWVEMLKELSMLTQGNLYTFEKWLCKEKLQEHHYIWSAPAGKPIIGRY